MSDNVEDAVPQILQAIQRQIAELGSRVDRQIADLRNTMEARFSQVDDVLRKQRRGTAGLLVMAKSLSGNFAEEVAVIEERVSALGSRDAVR